MSHVPRPSVAAGLSVTGPVHTDTSKHPTNLSSQREGRNVAMRNLIPRRSNPPPTPARPPMPPPAPTMLRIATDGAVIDFPAPVLRPDARCFAATCWPDPTQPGGWGRAVWWGPTSWRPGYQPVALEYSDIIEFGADLPVGRGRKITWLPIRWYGIMLNCSPSELVAHGPHPSAADAYRVAAELRSSLAYRLIGSLELARPDSTRPPLRPGRQAQPAAWPFPPRLR